MHIGSVNNVLSKQYVLILQRTKFKNDENNFKRNIIIATDKFTCNKLATS